LGGRLCLCPVSKKCPSKMADDQKTTEPGPEFEPYLEWIDNVDPRTPEALSPPSEFLLHLPFKPVSPTKKDLSYLNRVFSDYDGYELMTWVSVSTEVSSTAGELMTERSLISTSTVSSNSIAPQEMSCFLAWLSPLNRPTQTGLVP